MRALRRTVCLLLTLLWLAPHAARAEEFKLFLDDSRRDFIMVKPQDCSIHKNEDGRITLGFKLGGPLFGIGPEVTFGKKTGVDWHHTLQGLIARYQELCARFNTGAISKAEYDRRLNEIEKIENDAYALYIRAQEEAARRKQDIFNELDREVAGTAAIAREAEKLNSRLQTMK